MKNSTPRIRFIEDVNYWVSQYIEFSILREYKRQTPNDYIMDKHWIWVRIPRDPQGSYELIDGSRGTFNENPHIIPARYFLSFDTNLKFDEFIGLLKNLGIPLNTRILSLKCQGGETYAAGLKEIYEAGLRFRKHPITFSEINAELVELVMSYDSINLELETRPRSMKEVNFTYEQEKENTPSDDRLMQRTIRYSDTQIQKPRFDQILSAAAIEFKPEEKKMLEDVIEQSLQL